MEIQAIDVGILSIIPPLIAIILALLTKQVVPSLLLGILSGVSIYVMNVGGGIDKIIEVTVDLMSSKFAANINIVLFLCFLGALVAIVTMAGGSKAYGEWAVSKIKTRTGAKLSTAFLGLIIFIDDYFNCLTIGTVMKPVTDKHNISRAKLAYIIDSTAAPICIIAPISSWAASVISQLEDSGVENGIGTFISAIPFNLYAILTIILVVVVCTTNIGFGPMKRFENSAFNGNDVTVQQSEINDMEINEQGNVIDLILPILILIVTSVISMLYVGGFFEGGLTIAEGFGNTDASKALALSGFVTLILTFILFIPRKVISFTKFMEGINAGIKSMVPAFVILVLAWTISGVCRDLLAMGEYVGHIVEETNFMAQLIPAFSFLVAGGLAFAMGTSWGTFGILIPIITVVCQQVAPELITVSIAAVLAGSVFGDHCSPISDTTILSSTGSGCKHIFHISSQLPYAVTVASVSFIGYIIAGFTNNVYITMASSLVLLVVAVFIVIKLHKVKDSVGVTGKQSVSTKE